MSTSARLRVTWLEVFAEAPLEGTLHVVVHDADAIGTATMARLATRLRLPETSYVQAPTGAKADYLHRIFTIAGEIPFAGHPSLGTAVAVARAHGHLSTRLTQQTGAGLQELRVDLDASGMTGTAEITQNPAEWLGEPAPDPVLAALGLRSDDRHPTLRSSVISTGLPTLIVPVRDVEALGRSAPDLEALGRALAAVGEGVLTCYVATPLTPDAWRARCFTPQVAGGEDPATGSAAGPLTAFAYRELGAQEIVIDQAIELGSRSRLYGRVQDERVVVSGGVRVIGEGSMDLPVLPG